MQLEKFINEDLQVGAILQLGLLEFQIHHDSSCKFQLVQLVSHCNSPNTLSMIGLLFQDFYKKAASCITLLGRALYTLELGHFKFFASSAL